MNRAFKLEAFRREVIAVLLRDRSAWVEISWNGEVHEDLHGVRVWRWGHEVQRCGLVQDTATLDRLLDTSVAPFMPREADDITLTVRG